MGYRRGIYGTRDMWPTGVEYMSRKKKTSSEFLKNENSDDLENSQEICVSYVFTHSYN